MVGKFEEQYYDQLRAIERAIRATYQQEPDLVDFQVDKVLEGLVRLYQAERDQKRTPKLRLKADEKELQRALQQVCELHLGRDADVQIGADAITIDEMLDCLKRIRKSVTQMGGKGRQSYVNFLDDFFAEDS
jgi:hypothetical protein